MKQFYPHASQTRVDVIGGRPKIFVPPKVLEKIYHIVDLSQKEVGWLGRVEKGNNLDFILGDVYLFEQEVSYSETEIKADDLARFGEQLLVENENGADIWNSIRLWGHLHPHGSTSPSFQDERQMQTFIECGHPWFLRLIVTKNGKMEFALYLIEKGVIFLDVPWEILTSHDSDLRTTIQAELKQKVHEKKPPKKLRKRRNGKRGTPQVVYLSDESNDRAGFPGCDEVGMIDPESYPGASQMLGLQSQGSVLTKVVRVADAVVVSDTFPMIDDDPRFGGNGNGR